MTRGSTGIRTPGHRVTCNLQPESDTLTTWPSCLGGVLENKCLKNLHQNVVNKYQWLFFLCIRHVLWNFIITDIYVKPSVDASLHRVKWVGVYGGRGDGGGGRWGSWPKVMRPPPNMSLIPSMVLHTNFWYNNVRYSQISKVVAIRIITIAHSLLVNCRTTDLPPSLGKNGFVINRILLK